MTRSSSSPDNDDQDKLCNEALCRKKIRCATDVTVICDGCDSAYHLRCSGMSSGLQKEMKKNDQVRWFCEKCNKSVSHLLAGLANLSQKVDSLTVSHDELIKRVSDLEQRSEAPGTVTWPSMPDGGTGATQAAVTEMRDIESRKGNVVLFNVEESTAEDGKERQQHDMDLVSEVITELLPGVSSPQDHVKAVVRLGGREGGKKRPLRVILDGNDFRTSLLRKRRNLKDAESTVLKTCFMKPDLTRLQQQEDKDNYLKCKAARDEGKYAFIRNGKVIIKDTPPPASKNCPGPPAHLVA